MPDVRFPHPLRDRPHPCAPRLAQVEAIAAARPAGLILREKNLPEADYQALASDVLRICNRYEVPCILHTFVGVAQALCVKQIHLPLPVLRAQNKKTLSGFAQIGVSCHSVAEAFEA
ncbi:MAG: thiamine phosphate synthase, partial [Evtepia sp.]